MFSRSAGALPDNADQGGGVSSQLKTLPRRLDLQMIILPEGDGLRPFLLLGQSG